MARTALLFLIIVLAWPAAAQPCGADEPPCAVPLGHYRALHTSPTARPPAIVFFHGAGGSGADILRRADIVGDFATHGYVVIAPEGLVRRYPQTTGWHFRPNETLDRDELAFVAQVLDDAERRFGIDRRRVLLAGESVGGSLVWYLACHAPTAFAAFAPVAGGFWSPLPGHCAGPTKLLHTHGWRDETVPLEGRSFRDGTVVQGDIFAGLARWRATDGCATQAPMEIIVDNHAWRRVWTGCAPGSSLELVLHDGGHDVPVWWAAMARRWFERVTAR